MTSSFSFHAQVAGEAIAKVGRLFNATIDDILNELLQNARRAGATKVLIDQVDDPEIGRAIRIADNGAGLDDPRSLFSLGHSGWSSDLTRSEDAAGMGFFVLANRGALILARQKGTGESWSIDATHDAFHGRLPVTVSPGPDGAEGVTVIFPQWSVDSVERAVQRVARFFPIPVVFNGKPMHSVDFLDGADHIEEWRGIRIGVHDGDRTWRGNENANFHGVTLAIPLPSLQQSWHRSYHARIDVVDCAHLKLVLPARKEVVRDAMYEALVQEINRLYFRLAAAAGPHSLSFADYQRGLSMGISLPKAAPLLRPFTPSIADIYQSTAEPPKVVSPDAFVYRGESTLEEQNVARALQRLDESPQVVEPNPLFDGYGWYDDLPRLTAKTYRLHLADVIQDIDTSDVFRGNDRPDRLELGLEVTDKGASRAWLVGADLIVAGPDYGALDEMDIRVTRRSTITPMELQSFLIDALFSPSDDPEAGSYQQQQEWFADEAEDVSMTLLQSLADADRNALLRAVEREIAWRLPPKGSVVIRIDDRKVSVEGLSLPSSVDAADSSPSAIAG